MGKIKEKCPHCNSAKLSVEYIEQLDEKGIDDPQYGQLLDVICRDCLNCGELAVVAKWPEEEKENDLQRR